MRILIWGVGKLARHYMKFECFSGHEIIGFVDSYAEEKSFKEYPIYRPNEIGTIDYDYLVISVEKDNDVILKTCISEGIALERTVFLHSREELKEDGAPGTEQILDIEDAASIFPALYKNRKESQTCREYYNNLLPQKLKDEAFIRNLGENHVIVWIPIELLFSERTEENILDVYTEEWIRQNKRWENIPIISFAPYKSLFLFFLQGNDYPDLYCKWYQNLFTSRGSRSGYTDEELIEKRFREFKIMQQELNKGMDFFIENPAAAKWNRKGYFNLIDGHHRVSFLYYSGLTRMPVQITKEAYETWCNKKNADIAIGHIIGQHRMEFYQPILNPYFVSLNPYRENYTKSRLHHLLELFHAKSFAGKKVIDIGANLGYMGQAFYRMGSEVTLLEPDRMHYELLEKVNELLYTKCEIVTEKFEEYITNKKFDIAILLTVFYHFFLNAAVRDKFIQHLNKNVTQMIIWESGDLPEEERDYIIGNTKFKIYKKICCTYATGKFREMGVFVTEDSEYLRDVL